MRRRSVTNWGNFPVADAEVVEATRVSEVRDAINSADHLIARGNGRCYGDASLGPNILSTLKLNRFLAFDPAEGMIECESGVLLDEMLRVTVPRGLFLTVTPGTKFITLGGAIAADVHGKNHHLEGSFSRYVESFYLMKRDGTAVLCSRKENAELFWRTVGGMGLTGVILSARVRLKRIETSFIDQRMIRTANISETVEEFEENAAVTYSVAWVDCSAGGKALGRSILQIGEHASLDKLPKKFAAEPLAPAAVGKLALPVFMPSFALNALSVKAFNTGYYHRPIADRQTVHFDPFFYPLDGIHDWNRAYGRQGFVQYQFVLPLESSRQGVVDILEKVRASGEASPLAVLKLFGEAEPEATMSFPMKGYTLTLDMKATDRVFRLLDELDEIVAEMGGRVYLAKDARMSPEMFARMYPHRVRSGFFRSSQAVRLRNFDE